MAGPLRYWPNRKSKNGHRPLSRVPRHHTHAWSTTPPIAKEDEVTDTTTTDMRRILRGMVLAMTDSSDAAQAKTSAMLETIQDQVLVQIAQEALANFKRAKISYDKIENELKSVRKDIDRIRSEYSADETKLKEAMKATQERDDIAAKYKELQKQLDPEKHQLEIMYAIDEATKALREESAGLRRELGQRQTEIEALKNSKKRLREALDRLAGKD